ncbi:ankyrin repeat domain-containing protein 34B isoform X2 [Pangasianodon hypophthalmus]|uniref:ankyrin repeat domain-containing protein 34B isoform X2 n=1 Tax=Pangasianodon hypophthalmus TaxID=310915 RepID=UPI002307E496|nr:ankyrin repeat domain-containing protein 34B isoform X2 [Pangasianodon hypophthalmus]XP_053085172.1 ankyrin repeat domain-containing protein 34B isoform X2 [Pangasianodon hypophthalmus]
MIEPSACLKQQEVMEDSTEVWTDGNSLLKAVYLCRLRLTRLLLEGGAYINESNERGETPLMIACKTHHTDAQSVPKHKIVRYLLENGADPNIQDKSGKTALMHACVERAGQEVLSQLLSSGADLSLEDHSGSSALVYAVNAGDKEALRVLLDACKAKGKEVIIITTDKLPSGRQMTKQYLNVPPPPDLEDRLHCVTTVCMSPSEIKLSPSHVSSHSSQSQNALLHLAENQAMGSASATTANSRAGSPTRDPSPLRAAGVAKLLHLQRLHSEPWLKIPPSLLLQQSKASSFTEELLDITPEEELSFGFNSHRRLSHRAPPVARHQSMDATGLLRALDKATEAEKEQKKEVKWLSRKMSYDGVSLPHSASHQNLLKEASGGETIPMDKDPDCLPNLAVSSLQDVVRRRNIGMDHYSSDSQLPQFGSQHSDELGKAGTVGGGGTEKRKLVYSRSSTLSGSRESLESIVQRRSPAMMERRGSGALLLDHIAQTRPGYLPPLNPHAPIPDIKVNITSTCVDRGTKPGPATAAGTVTIPVAPGQRHFVPCAPSLPRDQKTKKTLLRRHSMQTEQIKRLANFGEIFGQ